MLLISLLPVIDVSDPQHRLQHCQHRNHLGKDWVADQTARFFEVESNELIAEGAFVNDFLDFVNEFELVAFQRGRGEPLDGDVLPDCLTDCYVHIFVLRDVVLHSKWIDSVQPDEFLHAGIIRLLQWHKVFFERQALQAVIRLLAIEHIQHLPGIVRVSQPRPIVWVLWVLLVAVVLCENFTDLIVVFDELFLQC